MTGLLNCLGCMEDVLIKVDKFIILAYFVVLDTKRVPTAKSHVPMILGCPFLATFNALTNCINSRQNYLLVIWLLTWTFFACKDNVMILTL